MDERTFAATVAERAGLSREEAADLTRATFEDLAGQLSGGELARLATALPDWVGPSLPRHDGRAHPKPLRDCIQAISGRTGLTEEETRRGVRSVLGVLREIVQPRLLHNALAQLPLDYRELAPA